MGPVRGSRLVPCKPGLHFHCATGLFVSPKDSRACCTPWSVLQDGSDEATFSQQSAAQSRRARADSSSLRRHCRSSSDERLGPTDANPALRACAGGSSDPLLGRRDAPIGTAVRPSRCPKAGKGTSRPSCGKPATHVGQHRAGVRDPRMNRPRFVRRLSAALPRGRPEPDTERRLATFASLLTVSRSL